LSIGRKAAGTAVRHPFSDARLAGAGCADRQGAFAKIIAKLFRR
jgi:hypothetical protein